MTYGLSGISPYTSGLGTVGLSGFNGMYTMDPTMMYGLGGMSGMSGMMGMYNPAFMAQMSQAQLQMLQTQQEMEKQQLRHTGNMHDTLMDVKMQNMSGEERALFTSLAQDGGIKSAIGNLAEVIRTGNQDEICRQYDIVKQTIITKYSSYLKNNMSTMTPEETVRGVIEGLYSKYVSAQAGEAVTLQSDIRKYGESAFKHGFNKAIWGGDDYHGRYTEQTLSYITGTKIDNLSGKEKMHKRGEKVGYAVKFGSLPVVGLIAGGLIGAAKQCGWKGAAIGTGIGLLLDGAWWALGQ